MFGHENVHFSVPRPGVSSVIFQQLRVQERRGELCLLTIVEHRTLRVSILNDIYLYYLIVLFIYAGLCPLLLGPIRIPYEQWRLPCFRSWKCVVPVESSGSATRWWAIIWCILHRRSGLVVVDPRYIKGSHTSNLFSFFIFLSKALDFDINFSIKASPKREELTTFFFFGFDYA